MGRITPTLDSMYHEVLGDYKDRKEFLWKHRGRFVHFVQTGIADGLLNPQFSRRHFRLERLSYALVPARDRLLSQEILSELHNNRLLRKDNILRETPQYYWMRLAMTEALKTTNPTRTALELYEQLSKAATLPAERDYPADIFNNQRLLFDTTRPVRQAGARPIPNHYFEHGWAIVDNVADEFEAIRMQEDFINSASGAQSSLEARFHDRIQLAKADQIPVCDDIVATSFQVLHFDMGHPFLEGSEQLFVSHVGIYLPKITKHEVTARTRLVELGGLLKHLNLSSQEIEQKVADYVRRFGDGWTGHNSYRLACFIRLLDALSDQPELHEQIDKTVGQWFKNENKLDASTAYQQELAFYAKHGIRLSELEHQIALQPGQLLILDNTRVIHGRIGKRKTKELFNYMWGVEKIGSADIAALRRRICQQLADS